MELVIKAGNRAVAYKPSTCMRCRTGMHETEPVQHDFMAHAVAPTGSLNQATSWHTERAGPPRHLWHAPGTADILAKQKS